MAVPHNPRKGAESAGGITMMLNEILPSEVFVEALNIFGKKIGRQEATTAGKALLARHVSGSLRIIRSGETLLSAAQDQ